MLYIFYNKKYKLKTKIMDSTFIDLDANRFSFLLRLLISNILTPFTVNNLTFLGKWNKCLKIWNLGIAKALDAEKMKLLFTANKQQHKWVTIIQSFFVLRGSLYKKKDDNLSFKKLKSIDEIVENYFNGIEIDIK